MSARKVVCTACVTATAEESRHCHECKGKRYIEIVEKPATCTQKQPECPISYDPGVHGWECSRCGDSGPV